MSTQIVTATNTSSITVPTENSGRKPLEDAGGEKVAAMLVV